VAARDRLDKLVVTSLLAKIKELPNVVTARALGTSSDVRPPRP